MTTTPLPFHIDGNLGNDAGAGSDGVLHGQIAASNPSAVLLKAAALGALCYTRDGGVYTNETAALADATGDDVEALPATPAVDDAIYYGLADQKFDEVQVNITTQGAGTWTIALEYWNGSAYVPLTGVTDGTTGLTAATGWVSITFTRPTDWDIDTVDGVSGYYVRQRVSAYTSVTTAPQLGQGRVVVTGGGWVDETTDFTDAGAGDVMALPTVPGVGDGLYIVSSERFCKIKVTTSQARTGTATIVPKYWNGSAWTPLATYADDSAGYSATAGTHFIHFVPPSDWVANTAANGPNGVAGFCVVMELTVLTDVTQQPLITQGWIYSLKTSAEGTDAPKSASVVKWSLQAGTASAENANSVILLVNCTRGTAIPMTWAKADAFVEGTASFAVTKGDELAVVQVIEDGTTEFADATITVQL